MVGTEAVAGILGIESQVHSIADLDRAVSNGLEKSAVIRLVSRIALNDREARTLRDQVVPLATWKRTTGRLSRQASERAERLARVMAQAEYVWDDGQLAKEWMNKPHPELGGRTPLATASTELGARTVEYILNCLFYGNPA